MKALFCIFFEIVLLIVTAVCLVDMWGWFISPLGVAPIIIPQAIGIIAVMSIFTPLRGKDENELLILIFEKTIRIALTYLTGYLASIAM